MANLKTAYAVEVGILLPADDPEYKYYSNVYDKKHAFYDENQYYCLSEAQAVEEALDYITNGNETTYDIVSKTVLPEEAVDELTAGEAIDLDGMSYDVKDVIFAAYKKDGVIENLF